MSSSQLGPDGDVARCLYEEHVPALLRYVQRLMRGDRQLAEDIVQETMLRAWQHADDVAPRARRPWLFTTARNLTIDVHRARRARGAEMLTDETDDEAVVSDGIDAALDAVLVMDALQALSVEHRSVLFDCYYRGRTAAQVADARGLPPGTVRSRLHYALRALRLALQERGVSGT